MPARPKVVFAGLARDCAGALPPVLDSISRMAEAAQSPAFLFIENDSEDGTRERLAAWCAGWPRAELTTFDGLVDTCPTRTVRLSRLRNRYVERVREAYADYDYLVVIDCDEANSLPLTAAHLQRVIAFLEESPTHAGAFTNQQGVYVDMWALRHDRWCPDDPWEAVVDYAIAHRVSDEDAWDATFAHRAPRIMPMDAPPLPVRSAFGGLGVYKVSSVLANPRAYAGYKLKTGPTAQGPVQHGWQVCEHVPFNEGFAQIGQQLFVLPWLVNRVTPSWDFPPSVFRELIFNPATLGPQDKPV